MTTLSAVLLSLGLLLPAPPVLVPAATPVRTARAPAAAPPSTAQWPLEPRPDVVAGFDPPQQDWDPGHRGVDLLGTPGSPVRSALAGTVSFAGSVAGRGVVVVDHGRFRTTYEPVRAGVRAGDGVATGAVIGTLQPARGHCLPQACLHWGLREGETYLDPLSLLGLRPVRLLPVR